METADTELKTELEAAAPPMLMCTARPGELRIGPTLYEILKRIELTAGERRGPELDAVLKREGFRRTYEWLKDGAGAWTFVVMV